MQSCAIFLFVEEIELRPKDARLYNLLGLHTRKKFIRILLLAANLSLP